MERQNARTSDGAISITGVQDGVGAYFKREIPTLVQIHCINHWLALAEKDSSTSVAYFEEYFDILDHVALFYDYKVIQRADLKEMQQMLNNPILKLGSTIDTCWLSKDKTCTNLKKIFQAVLKRFN